jgi:hypothetical protein
MAVDQWISRNSLNQFGDPISTNYAGGNPLFYSGQSRYQYIVSQNPERPWSLLVDPPTCLSESSGESLRQIAEEVRSEKEGEGEQAGPQEI